MPHRSYPDSDFTTCDPLDGSAERIAFRVLICDRESSRIQLIKRLIVEVGGQPLAISETGRSGEPFTLDCHVALVGLAREAASHAQTLLRIRALVNSGLAVICYADEIRTWSLKRRCNLLLAGALTLFDSALPEFPGELKRSLIEVLQVQDARGTAEACMKAEMKQLGVIGESRAMSGIFSWVQKASTLSDLPALITGESGTGKELIVNAIHQLDRKRSTGPLIALNCGAISAGVAESELFGHRRGAFTGAERDRKGLIRAADGGTLFLDEIGDLDLGLQSKLLRVLQESRVLSLGEDREVPVNVRVIAATNRNLEEMVKGGEFRHDLFHRLNILSVHIPALRHRPADLQPLVHHFIEKHYKLWTGPRPAVSPDFIEALAQLELPGNVREVENLVRRALVKRVTNSPLSLSDLPAEILGKLAAEAQPAGNPNADSAPTLESAAHVWDSGEYAASLFSLLEKNQSSLSKTLEQCERYLITTALEHSHGNQSVLAKLLGITPRSVYNKLRKHELR